MSDSLPRRRWFRFSLRSLLLAMFVIAVWLGWLCNRARQQKASVAGITKLGGTIIYDHEYDGDQVPFATSIGSLWRQFSGRELYVLDAEPRGPRWLRRWIGDDFFQTVVAVDLSQYPTQVNDDDLRHLRDLVGMRRLLLDNCEGVTDRGLECIQGLHKLERLYLDGTSITDRGLVHLRGLAKLEYLSLEGTKITDDGLIHLKQLPRLRWLNLSKTRITNQGLEELIRWENLGEVNLHDTDVTDEAAEKARKDGPPWIITAPVGVVG